MKKKFWQYVGLQPYNLKNGVTVCDAVQVEVTEEQAREMCDRQREMINNVRNAKRN